MVHLKLGEILIQRGLINESQLNQAMELQKKERGRIGEILIKLDMVKEEDIVSALGTQLSLPTSSELTPQMDQNLDKLVPKNFATKHLILPLSRNMNVLTIAVFDPLDLLMLDNLEKMTGCKLNFVIATRKELAKAIEKLYALDKTGEGQGSLFDEAVKDTYSDENLLIASLTESEENSSEAQLSLDKLIAKAEEAPVIKLVDLIIRQAIDERASDIHIEPFKDKISLRYRIDGNLYQIPPPSRHLLLPIVSRVKILAKLDIAEKRLPQDGAISAKLEDRVVDIRISTIPTVWGEKVVMRILDKSAVPLKLMGLGYTSQQLELIRKVLKTPYGLFFVTGPTGSGKSTTLYAALNETIDPTKNVLTIEDPVEFKLEHINQVNVKNEIGLTFATALRAFLRQDPDIIMVGEVRDLETAQICVRAALTGHFVLSTLHTNDAAAAITRLLDIGVESYLLTPSLVMIVAQRLARRLCPDCKEPYEPDPSQHGGLAFKSDLIYRAKGCDECNQIGYKGRFVISEVMPINDDIRRLITSHSPYIEIKDVSRKSGMDTLFDAALKRVEDGTTSLDEILTATVN